MATIELPQMEVTSGDETLCVLSLGPQNLASNGTQVTVDSQNAYLPFGVHQYLIGIESLAVTQSRLTVHTSIAKNGDLTTTESAPLMRCSAGNDYAPTTMTCPHLVTTGVTFERVSRLQLDDHQVQFRDRFVSTDHSAHRIGLEYGAQFGLPGTGLPGYTYPGHSSTFAAQPRGTVVGGLGTKAATMFIRSDIDALDGDTDVDTMGLSWSRAPSQIMFSTTTFGSFELRYALNVPARGTAYLGFATSEKQLNADAHRLAGPAVAAMINAPRITSPHNRAKVHGKRTKVSGVLSLGANGLPTSVTVNGHKAHLAKTATGEKFTATFTESYGAHTIKVSSRDGAGNTATAKVSVRNVRHH
jgi:hypothetical protein